MPEIPQALLEAAGERLREHLQTRAAPLAERLDLGVALSSCEDTALRGLARALASQADAGRYLSLRPRLLERIAAARPATLAERGAELGRLSAPAPDDLEHALDELRLLRRDETLLAATLDLGGGLPFPRVSEFLSILAECATRQALELAEQVGGHGESGLAVLAMGKLAGREMTYESDLDLIFLYEPDPAAGAEAGALASRIAQRLISYLGTMTGAGVAYQVDARLRPSGRQGALVSTFDAFARYQCEQAADWEHLALTRTRAVAGPIELAQRHLAAVRQTVRSERGVSWPAIEKMRERVERERGAESAERIAFKTGAGGIMDVEFLAAGGWLQHAEQLGDDLKPNVPDVLTRLLGSAASEALLGAYQFLRRLEARARWVAGRAVETLDLSGEDAETVAELVEPGLSVLDLGRGVEASRATIRRAFRSAIAAGDIRAATDP